MKERKKQSSLYGRQAAQEILRLGAAASLSPEVRERISLILNGTVDWQYLLDLAEFHAIAPLIAHNLMAAGLAERIHHPAVERFNKIYHKHLYMNVILADELARVIAAFGRHTIPVIILKGTVLAEQLYGNPGLRAVTDMDILVPPDKMPLAGSLLLELNYEQLVSRENWEHPFHEAPYRKTVQFPFFIELHWNLSDRQLAEVPLNEIWRRARPVLLAGGSAMVLSPEDTLIYLANNLSKQDNQLLKYLCDISELLKKYNGSLDWDYIVKSAVSWKIETIVYYALKQSQAVLGAPVPVPALHLLKPKAWRRGILALFNNPYIFIRTSGMPKLRAEIYVLVQALMMRRPSQMRAVLSGHRNDSRRLKWFRSALWVLGAFIGVLVLNTAGVAARLTRRADSTGN